MYILTGMQWNPSRNSATLHNLER